MPRQAKRPTAPEIRDRNTRDLLGRPGLAGLARIGGIGARGRGGQSVLTNVVDDVASSENAQLLVLAASVDSIAAGGDYVSFTSIVAQHGFSGVGTPTGGAWVHPISGVYVLTFEMEWDTYQGGGTVQLELDGTAVPEGLIGDGAAGQEGRGTIVYVADAGQVGKIKVTHADAAAQTCAAMVRIAITDPKVEQPDDIGGDAVSVGLPDEAPWSGSPTDLEDRSAHWIWHTALSGGSRPDFEWAWLDGRFQSLTARAVTIEAASDNEGDLYLNGTLLGPIDGYGTRTTFSAILHAGLNQFAAAVQNTTGVTTNPAGFIMSVTDDATGDVLFRTTDEGGWFAYTAEPAGWPTP